MLIDAALGLANHLLVSEDWARNRLKAFAGQTARLQLGALNFPLEITADGRFRTGDKNATSAVTITLPADAPIRAVTAVSYTHLDVYKKQVQALALRYDSAFVYT